MAEIDPIVAEILLKGDDEFLNSLKKIGEEGAENIHKLVEASKEGGSAFELLSRAISPLEAAISGITAAMIVFIEQQTELTQKTILLADAFGTTAGQLQELEAVFAASGVKVQQFERFANRLTVTIAREWPQIADSIRNYANENDASQLRVTNAILRVQEAQNRLADNSEARASQMLKDNQAVEAAYIRLQFSAQKAASEQLGAQQAVRGAELSTVAALQHLADLEGRPPSTAEKQNLALAQAQQAVDQARKGEADARIAQQEKAAEADLKRRQEEAAYNDLARKAAKDARDDAEQRQRDENAVKEAVIARGEAEQKATEFALKNIVSIRAALDGIVEGNKAAANAVNLTEVSVENLTKAIIAQAAEHSKSTSPSGYETLRAISELFGKDVDNLIDKQQRLAIVNKLSGTSMQALGVSAAEILNVLENDAEHIKNLSDATDEFGKKVPPEGIEKFRGALAGLNLQISILSQRLASAIAPAFTAFLNGISESLSDTDGTLHMFIEGVKDLVAAIGTIISAAAAAFVAIDNALGGNAQRRVIQFKVVVIGLITILALIAGPFIQIPILIGLVVTAMGGLTEVTKKVWAAMKDNSVTRFWERLLDVVAKLKSLLSGKGWKNPMAADAAAPDAQPQSQSQAPAPATTAYEGAPVAMAQGGSVSGPGTSTSDSVFAKLSNGEFVVKAAAVAAYGTGLFHALNNMQLPGFAAGGLVASPVRLAGGSHAPSTSVLNLSIDGRSFNGLRGPKSTIDDLSSFAVARQASAAGNNPSWVK
jgi:hypothetical protein